MYVLGVDFGGGAGKATLMAKDGRIVSTATAEYPTYYGDGGMAEQDPRDWYVAAVKNIRAVLKGVDPADVDCICFDAATHTAVLLDKEGEPVMRSVYWTDTRSVPERDMLEREHGDLIRARCKHSVDTIWSLPEIMLARRLDPESFARTERVTFAKDYVRGRFTGDTVTDYIEAEGSMLFDYDRRDWVDELLAVAGLTRAMMPRIVSPLDIAGYVTREASSATGLAVGTPVVTGATDTAMEVLAAGAVRPGDATLKLATAGRVCVVTEAIVPDRNIVNYSHAVEGLFYPGAATKSCASSLRWFRDCFGGDYAEMDEQAEKIPLGADGLIFNPHLMGELTPYADPKMSGSFVGIRSSMGRGHFARAIMEGVALSLLDCKLYLEERGITLGERVYSIGGGAKSPLWRSIVADCLGITLAVTERSDSSLGSCMLAAVAAGYFGSIEEAAERCNRVVDVTEPNPENTEKYRKLYVKYKRVGDLLSELAHME